MPPTLRNKTSRQPVGKQHVHKKSPPPKQLAPKKSTPTNQPRVEQDHENSTTTPEVSQSSSPAAATEETTPNPIVKPAHLTDIRCPVSDCLSGPFTDCGNPTRALKIHLYNEGFADNHDHEEAYMGFLDNECYIRGKRRALAAVKLSGEVYSPDLIHIMARQYVVAMREEFIFDHPMVEDELYSDDEDYLP